MKPLSPCYVCILIFSCRGWEVPSFTSQQTAGCGYCGNVNTGAGPWLTTTDPWLQHICHLHAPPPAAAHQPPPPPHPQHRSRVMFNYNLLLYFGFPGYFVFCIKGFIYIISLWAYLIFDKYLHSIKSTLHSTTISIHRKTFMISIYQPSYRKKYSGFVANTQLRICSQ